MDLKSLSSIELPPTADFHVHLRQDKMMHLVTPLVQRGGCDIVYVMPNLTPPIRSVAEAVEYHSQLTKIAPGVTFLMSLFLHPGLNADIIAEAKRSGVVHGVKLYPAGVTTNSKDGVLDIEAFYPVFQAMESHDLILNIHGEMVSSKPETFAKEEEGKEAVTVMNAEARFLPQLHKLHAAFPKLRIVLEHVSTREALEAVRKCGPTVAGSITAHHLWICLDDTLGNVFNFCKPIAKTPADRIALVRAVVENSGKFFFGSDSAPHPIQSKKGPGSTAAGCFTQPWVTSLVLDAVEEGMRHGWIKEEEVTQEALENFLTHYGRAFYKVPQSSDKAKKIRLQRHGEVIPETITSDDGEISVVPFRSGAKTWSVSWLS